MSNGLSIDILNSLKGVDLSKFTAQIPGSNKMSSNIDSPMDMELQNDLKVLTNENNTDFGLNNDQSNVSGIQNTSFSNILNGKIESNNFASSPGETENVANSISSGVKNYVNNINSLQNNADKAIETFASGGNIDMHSVMVAAEKANVSMQLTMQLRNKILSAYQEISRMQA